MLRRLWLVFAQASTIGLALFFVISTLKPHWLNRAGIADNAIDGRIPATMPAPLAVLNATAPLDPAPPRANALVSYADAARAAMPAVVNVYTTKEIRRSVGDPLFKPFFGDRSGDSQRVSSLGSGVIASAQGYVLTNNHVVQAADEISVALSDGRRVDAKLVGTDPETDLAVLRINLPNLPAVTFGRSETLKVGDVVLAIGNPFDVGQTVTMGIVSALGRSKLGINTFENFIQTDAAINQGNSGGALVDSNGQLVGINTAIFSRSGDSIGIGFAIPTTTITQVLDQIIKMGRVRRGYFGVETFDITPDLVEALKLPRNEGVVVRGVVRDAPAGRAGIEPGDVIVEINDRLITDRRFMLDLIAQLAPNSTAKVKILRSEKSVELKVTVGERPTVAAPR